MGSNRSTRRRRELIDVVFDSGGVSPRRRPRGRRAEGPDAARGDGPPLRRIDVVDECHSMGKHVPIGIIREP